MLHLKLNKIILVTLVTLKIQNSGLIKIQKSTNTDSFAKRGLQETYYYPLANNF